MVTSGETVRKQRRNLSAHHFLRIVRGILLKGNTPNDVMLQLWQIALFALFALTIGIKRDRQTLD